jgi:hypothetical protein
MDLGALQQQFTDFINSDAVQLFFRAILIYIVLLWLATAFWAYRDMQQRTTNPIAPYLAATLIIVFTPLAFVFAYFLYKIVRPKETVSEANERALAEEAMLVEIESQPHCANCSRPVHEEWIICPTAPGWSSSTGRSAPTAARTSSAPRRSRLPTCRRAAPQPHDVASRRPCLNPSRCRS